MKQNSSNSVSRRSFIAGAASISTATLVAGCSGGSSGGGGSSDSQDPASQSSQFDSVSVSGANLVVKLASDADLSGLNLITSDGSVFSKSSISTGQTKVKLPIAKGYGVVSDFNPISSGNHTVVGIKGGEEVTKTTVSLERGLEVTEMTTTKADGQNDFSTDPPKYHDNIQFTLKNTGDIPIKLSGVGFTGGVLSTRQMKARMGTNVERKNPPEENEWILGAGMSMTVLSKAAMLTYNDLGNSSNKNISWASQEDALENACNTTRDATISIETQTNGTMEVPITIEYGGEATQRQMSYIDYGCTEVTVTQQNESN